MRLPDWIKTKSPAGIHETKKVLRGRRLSTVCEEARCPNIGACFAKPTATFMILGSSCTRNCGFCAVDTAPPSAPDHDEPHRVAEAALEMGLRYVVVTSVTRDDLKDGGASQFAKTIRALRDSLPGVRVEVLTPDFQGDPSALATVLAAGPDVFNHNVETVPRLYPRVRPQADYARSLSVLEIVKSLRPDLPTKSGMMVGLGETVNEIEGVMEDLVSVGCDLLTIGQYLRPSKDNLPVAEYVLPEMFDRYREMGLEMGFRGVASGPLVRSSMNAEGLYEGKES